MESSTAALQPRDETPMRTALLQLATRLPRIRLDQLHSTPNTPGLYLQFLATASVAPVLGTLVATGRYPAYVGVAAASLRERLGRYRQTLSAMSLNESELYISLLPCSSDASALFGEAALISELQPPLQGLGWGSKVPGSQRREQSPIDAIFPGRRWATPTGPRQRAIAHLRVLKSLVQLDPTGPRWDPLIASPSS
jgi:hypothetical protein